MSSSENNEPRSIETVSTNDEAAVQVKSSEAVVQSNQEQIDIDHFLKVQLRVATIESVDSIPKSKKLLKLQLDLGSYGKRQIISGIAQQYSPEQLIGRKIIVVANLKAATLMGHTSEGMLLAGSSEDDSIISILGLDVDLPAGARVR